MRRHPNGRSNSKHGKARAVRATGAAEVEQLYAGLDDHEEAIDYVLARRKDFRDLKDAGTPVPEWKTENIRVTPEQKEWLQVLSIDFGIGSGEIIRYAIARVMNECAALRERRQKAAEKGR
jgi:hypothetical protein